MELTDNSQDGHDVGRGGGNMTEIGSWVSDLHAWTSRVSSLSWGAREGDTGRDHRLAFWCLKGFETSERWKVD